MEAQVCVDIEENPLTHTRTERNLHPRDSYSKCWAVMALS